METTTEIIMTNDQKFHELLSSIKNYKIGHYLAQTDKNSYKLPEKIAIGLWGPEGRGKSSFINHLNMIFQGEKKHYHQIAESAPRGSSAHSGTAFFVEYNFTKNLSVFDGQGWKFDSPEQKEDQEKAMLKQLYGKFPIGTPIKSSETGELYPTKKYKVESYQTIHAMVVVVDREIDMNGDRGLIAVASCLKPALDRGYRPLILVTHKDTKTEKSLDLEEIRKIIGGSGIWEIENYWVPPNGSFSFKRKVAEDIVALDLLLQAIIFADRNLPFFCPLSGCQLM